MLQMISRSPVAATSASGQRVRGQSWEVQGSDDPRLLIDHSWTLRATQPCGFSKMGSPRHTSGGIKRIVVSISALLTTNPIVSFQPDGTTTAKVLQITGGAECTSLSISR